MALSTHEISSSFAKVGQREDIQTLEDLYLLSDKMIIDSYELDQATCRPSNICDPQVLEHQLKSCIQCPNENTSYCFIIPQQNSRSPFKITRDALASILSHVDSSAMLPGTIATFASNGSDCYLGRSGAHFWPRVWRGNNAVLELCCILKYVERNGRDVPGPHAWSLRQMVLHQTYLLAGQREVAFLFNPSADIRSRASELFSSSQPPASTAVHWTRTPAVVLSCLMNNWSEYITELHNAVDQIGNDAQHTSPTTPLIGEVTDDSLKKCRTYADLIQYASHGLSSNIATLTAIAEQIPKRSKWLSEDDANAASEEFRVMIDDLDREMRFAMSQLDLIEARLEYIFAATRDVISLRASFSIERMTAQSLTEARAVRIIALITLIFLPPTLTTGFLEMDYLHVTSISSSGLLSVSSKPDMWLFLALTVPLLVLTISGWIVWNWREERRRRRLLEVGDLGIV